METAVNRMGLKMPTDLNDGRLEEDPLNLETEEMSGDDRDLKEHEIEEGMKNELDKFDSDITENGLDVCVNKEDLKEGVKNVLVRKEGQHNRCNVLSGNIRYNMNIII